MLDPDQLTPVKRNRYLKILKVSRRLFAESGFRAVTMEGIASAAGISKATLYAYFSDKDELFEALIRQVARELDEAFSQALAREGPLEERIANAFLAKFRVTYDLVRTSPHAAELFMAKDRLQGDHLERLERALEERLTELLCDHLDSDLEPELLAKTLLGANLGIVDRLEDFARIEKAVRYTVSALLRGGKC